MRPSAMDDPTMPGEAARDPDREIVGVGEGEAFKIWSHGYPYRTVRWHFHPEYEIHLITATSGRFFVGDHVGSFSPGQLVMVGPNLPHNWVSDVAADAVVPERCIVLQFTEAGAAACEAAFPGMRIRPLLDACRRGLEFPAPVAAEAERLMRAMLAGDALSRPADFLALLGRLARADGARPLATACTPLDPAILAHPLNHVLDHIARNLGSELRESDLAGLCGYSASGFCRIFQQRTGMTFTAYLTAMRVRRACRLLTSSDRAITDICFDSGFNNVSNFNRRFLAQTAMTPRAYRASHRQGGRPHLTRGVGRPNRAAQFRNNQMETH